MYGRPSRRASCGNPAGIGSAPRAAFMPLRGRVDGGIDPYRVQRKTAPHRRGGHWPSAGVGRTRNARPYKVQRKTAPHRRGGHWPSAGVGRTRSARPYKVQRKIAPHQGAAFLRQIAQKWKPMEEYSWSMGSLLCYHASQKKKKVYGTEIIRCFFWEFAA